MITVKIGLGSNLFLETIDVVVCNKIIFLKFYWFSFPLLDSRLNLTRVGSKKVSSSS